MPRKLKIIVLVFSVCLSLAFVPAQQEKPSPAPDAPAALSQDAPRIVFEKLSHDFGKLCPDQRVNCEFKFKNEGTGILEIQKVKTSCGCTAALPDKKLIGPGESSGIRVEFHAGRASGLVDKTVSVSTNDPELPTATLHFTGMIVAEMNLSPASVRMTDIDKSKPAEQDVLITPRDPEKFELTNVESDTPAITVTTYKLPSGHIKLVVAFQPDKLPQPAPAILTGRIHGVTNAESQPELKLPVYIKFKQDYSAQPERVMIMGSGASREVVIHSSKGEPFQITGAGSNTPFIKVEITTNGQAANVIRISADGSSPNPIFRGEVTVTIDKQAVNIPVRVRMQKQPVADSPAAAPVQPDGQQEE